MATPATKRNGDAAQCHGAALVEVALVLPLLIVLLLICVDFGRLATVHIAVTNAAREGASFGGTHPFTESTYGKWKQEVTNALTAEMSGIPGYSEQLLTVAEPVVFASQNRSRVRVTVSYRFKPAIAWPIIPQELEISRTAEMPVIR